MTNIPSNVDEPEEQEDALWDTLIKDKEDDNATIARLTRENDELRKALIKFSEQVEKLAFNIPPPNPYTPNFVSLATAARNWANTEKS